MVKKVRCAPVINTATVEDSRWETTSLWTKTGTQVCQVIYKGVGGGGMGELALQVRGDEQECQIPPSKWKQQAETLCKIRDAKERCDAHNATRPESRTS